MSDDNPLEGLVDILNDGTKLAQDIGKPINAISSGLTTAQSIITLVDNFIGGLDDIVKAANVIGEVCFLLTEIPVAGEILDVLGTVLSEFGTTVQELLIPISDFKITVLDEVKSIITKVNDVLSKITKALNFFINNLSRWANIVQVIYSGWQIVHMLVSLLDGTEPVQRLKDLMDKFENIGSKVIIVFNDVSAGFKEVWKVLSDIFHPIWKVIQKFASWFDSIKDGVDDVLSIFSNVSSVVDKIKDDVSPIMWALDAIEFIFDVVVKPVIDWIMDELGLKALVDSIEDKLTSALHIDDFLNQLKSTFQFDQLTCGHSSLASSDGKTSRVHELDEILKEFIADPQQALINTLLAAISGTPVKDGAFPPPPPSVPPIDWGGKSTPVEHPDAAGTAFTLLFTSSQVKHPLKMKQSLRLQMKLKGFNELEFPPAVQLTSFPTIAAAAVPTSPTSPTDWSDVDVFVKDVDNIVSSLQPILTLGDQLKQFLTKVELQLTIPNELDGRLSDLSTETQFLYDFCDLLQLFPVFKEFLPAFTSSLKAELTTITSLKSDMSQFVDATTTLSQSIQPISATENPTLFKAINQLSSSLSSWKSQAVKYRDQLKQGYVMNQKAGNQFTSRLDVLAVTYHQRLGDLQSVLSQIQNLTQSAKSDGRAIADSLTTVTEDFDKIDLYVTKLEQEIDKVSELANFAGKLDGIFSPLKCLLTTYKCIGDQNGIKSMHLKHFKLLTKISDSPSAQNAFQQLIEQLMDKFFPAQTVESLVKTGLADIQSASSVVASTSQHYITTLMALQKAQAGKYQLQYKMKSGKTQMIDSHFFDQEQVKEILDLGHDLAAAQKTLD